jgi:hypothetical protein
VVYWADSNDSFKKVMEAFTGETGVEVNYEVAPAGYIEWQQFMTTRLASGDSTVDAFHCDDFQAAIYGAAGWLLELGPIIQEYNIDLSDWPQTLIKLMNTLAGLLLLYVSGLLPVTTWTLVSFLRQVPVEIEDAAKVDGAGFLPLLLHVVLPVVRPGMATMFVINFIVGWNEFFIPLIFARGPGAKVITMALSEAQVIGSSTQFYQS